LASGSVIDARRSFMLAAEFSVPDYERWWSVMRGIRDHLAELGVRRFVVYRSVDDPPQVFITVGLQTRERMDRVLSSPLLMEWFDRARVEDIPPIFVGTGVERISYGGADAAAEDEGGRYVPTGIVIARVVRLVDYDRYLAVVHAHQRSPLATGMRRLWIYRAVDDGAEVMSLQEVDTLEHARAWLRRPESAAEVDAESGIGLYPPIFVGTVADVMHLDNG
jgi:hypothetical protein